MAGDILSRLDAEERAQLDRLDRSRMPRHVAFIMDGNGRWAAARGLPREFGHAAGMKSARAAAAACYAAGVEYCTLYSFSTENWSRPEPEIVALMALIAEQLPRIREEALELNVKVRHVGRRAELPEAVLRTLDRAVADTAANTGGTLVLALNYSGRTELTDAARALAERVSRGELKAGDITEAALAEALYAPDIPDPDLLIRTAGEMRVSNFLLWEIAYSELWVTDTYWPDVRAGHVLGALADYAQRDRRFGGRKR